MGKIKIEKEIICLVSRSCLVTIFNNNKSCNINNMVNAIRIDIMAALNLTIFEKSFVIMVNSEIQKIKNMKLKNLIS